MKILEVIWNDITYKSAGWLHANDVEDFIKDTNENTVHQLGYLYKETDDLIILTDSYFVDERTYGAVHKIPKGCIKSITELCEDKKEFVTSRVSMKR